jgi:hypothetical protein
MSTIPSDEFNAQLVAMVKWWLAHQNDQPPTRPNRDLSSPAPIRGILLEDLVDEGKADCAVTGLDVTTFIQEVKIEGDVTGGTFTLNFKGQTTTALPFNATAAQMQAALEKLSTIGKGNVLVRLGKMTFTDSDGNGDRVFGQSTASPGLWLVEFVGTFARVPTAPPLMTVGNSLTMLQNPRGLQNLLVDQTTHWVDTGIIKTVNAIVPVGIPTPMKLGAVVAAIWFPGIGFGVVSCEGREFSQSYY